MATGIINGKSYEIFEKPTTQVKAWFFQKKLREGYAFSHVPYIYGVVKESEKAVLAIVEGGTIDSNDKYRFEWIPKSCIEPISGVE
jgi:hypothetical protein